MELSLSESTRLIEMVIDDPRIGNGSVRERRGYEGGISS